MRRCLYLLLQQQPHAAVGQEVEHEWSCQVRHRQEREEPFSLLRRELVVEARQPGLEEHVVLTDHRRARGGEVPMLQGVRTYLLLVHALELQLPCVDVDASLLRDDLDDGLARGWWGRLEVDVLLHLYHDRSTASMTLVRATGSRTCAGLWRRPRVLEYCHTGIAHAHCCRTHNRMWTGSHTVQGEA